jgi:membrane-associated phospholipid phosphatase
VSPFQFRALRVSELVALAWFAVVAVLALVRPLPRRRRVQVAGGALAACLGVVATAQLAPTGVSGVFRNLLPSLFVVAAYRLAGGFFVSAQVRLEQALLAMDHRLLSRLGLHEALARAPRAVVEVVEACYVAVYPLLPLGAVAAWYAGRNAAVDRFWTTVFLAEACSYLGLAWLQTRPPRALEPWTDVIRARSVVRRVNEAVLQVSSNQVNTIPSGHAAGAVAVALALASIDPRVALPFVLLAIAILAATVIGRYHFALDTLAGALVGLAAWMIVQAKW